MSKRNYIACLAGSFLMILVPGTVMGQTYPELDRYMESARELSVLFRGRQAEKYEFAYNGNCFWDGPQYLNGDISCHGKYYRGLEINIDAVLQTPLVRLNSSSIPIGLSPDDVEYLHIGDRLFENLRLQGHEEAKQGFYELLVDGGYRLYKRVDKKLNSSPENVNGTGIGYTDPYYKEKVYTYFEYIPAYFLQRDGGELVGFRSRGQLLKMLRRKKEIRKHIASLHPDGRVDNETYYVEAVKFVCR